MKIDPDAHYSTTDPEMRAVGAPQTLAQWRSLGKGPAYIKSGSRVKYRGRDVLKYLDENRRNPAAT